MIMKKTISFLFNILLIFTPLVLFVRTSELFEFNKLVFVYVLTVLITFAWCVRMIISKKFIFRKTILTIPILVFLSTQVLSSIFSIDVRTSLLGYYSRFHGGLFSYISYSLLYFAFVSNMEKKETIKSIKVIITSALLVSLYGILQHFGIDKEIWVQDVQSRIFSTLGQPNWLAAFLVALIPITWKFSLQDNIDNKESKRKKGKILWLFFFSIFLITLLFTKSRSGILGFVVSFIVFWGIYLSPIIDKFVKNKNFDLIKNSSKVKSFSTPLFITLVIVLFLGTPFSPSVRKIFSSKSNDVEQEGVQVLSPALETGGTESGEIRKIVWKGAFDTWKNYPIFGSGVETFGFIYYKFRPVEHNLVSEWDFIYNKAHNEYLNFLATTGLLGFLSYLFLVVVIIKLLARSKDYFLLSGFLGILVTNFFGFSVVPVALLFFLLPAISISLKENGIGKNTKENKNFNEGSMESFGGLDNNSKISIVLFSLLTLYLLNLVTTYWLADYHFAAGRLQKTANLSLAREHLLKAIEKSPNEALFWNELSKISSDMAVFFSEESKLEESKVFEDNAVEESEKAHSLSPKNVNILRDQSVVYIKLSIISQNYLLNSLNTLEKAIALAPTDAKLFYNLGLTRARVGDLVGSKETFKKTIDMKGNYIKARLALGLILSDLGERQKAIEELEYILENLDPDNKLVKQQLEELR